MVSAWNRDWDALPGADRAGLKARQGVRYPVLEGLTVMDPGTMAETPRDGETIGEVMMRGNVVMKGYLKNEDASAEAFAGGWFHTGDLGVMHEDGYIALKDRSKDIIISGGENISSVEVEQVLYRHPAVLEAAVVARPDEKWGETPLRLRRDAFGRRSDGSGSHRLLPGQHGPFQGPAPCRLRPPAQDLHRKSAEIRPPGTRARPEVKPENRRAPNQVSGGGLRLVEKAARLSIGQTGTGRIHVEQAWEAIRSAAARL